MSDFFRENWFVVLVALVILCFAGYFVYDSNKNVVHAGQNAEGQDVIAELSDARITADQLYDAAAPFDEEQLYNMYKNLVVNEAVKTDDEMTRNARNIQANIISNAKAQSENYGLILTSQLAGYGYASEDDLHEYVLNSLKEQKLDQEYVDAHYDELKAGVQAKNPRMISIITMAADDPEKLTEEEQKKKDSIDKALENDTFAKAATAFSEDAATASKGGSYGYIDADTYGVHIDVKDAAAALKKGETSDWIAVTDSNTGGKYLWKIHIDEDSLDTIRKDADDELKDTLLSTFISANPAMQVEAVKEAAAKLDIHFDDEESQKKIEDWMQRTIDNAKKQAEEAAKKAEEESSTDNETPAEEETADKEDAE